jgi:hypothetical protein
MRYNFGPCRVNNEEFMPYLGSQIEDKLLMWIQFWMQKYNFNSLSWIIIMVIDWVYMLNTRDRYDHDQCY